MPNEAIYKIYFTCYFKGTVNSFNFDSVRKTIHKTKKQKKNKTKQKQQQQLQSLPNDFHGNIVLKMVHIGIIHLVHTQNFPKN